MKPIPGFPGYYATEMGKIVSTKYREPRNLKPTLGSNGYHTVCMTNDSGVIKRVSAHRAIAYAFLGPCPAGYEVRHLDGNRVNNTPANLAYGTVRENRKDSEKHGTAAVGTRHGMHKLTENEVHLLRADYDSGAYSLRQLARKFDITVRQVGRIGKRKSWTSLPELAMEETRKAA